LDFRFTPRGAAARRATRGIALIGTVAVQLAFLPAAAILPALFQEDDFPRVQVVNPSDDLDLAR